MKSEDQDSSPFQVYIYFLFFLALAASFLLPQIVFNLIHLREIAFFSPNGGKRLEVLLFYGTSTLGALFYALLGKKFLESLNPILCKSLGLAGVGLTFLWAVLSKWQYGLALTNTLIISVLALTLVSIRRNTTPHLLFKVVNKHFANIMLFFAVGAIAAHSTEPHKNNIYPAFFSGIASVLLNVFAPLKFPLVNHLTKRTKATLAWGFFFFLLVLSTPSYPVPDIGSLSCLIGPILQDLFGSIVLTDYKPHYGLANGLFLRPIFQMLGAVDFNTGFIAGFLMCVSFWLVIFLFCKSLFSSWRIGLFMVFTSICFGPWGNFPVFYTYYSMGPYRFGLPFVMTMLIVLENNSGPSQLLKFFRILVLGVSSIWSFETAVFVAFPYMIFLIVSKRLKKELPFAFAGIALAWASIQFKIWLESGTFGNVLLFTESVGVEAVSGISSYNMSATGTWVPIWILLMFTVLISFRSYVSRKKDVALISITALLFICLSYFVNRSIDAVFLALPTIIGFPIFYLTFKVFPDTFRRYFYSAALPLVVFYLQGGITGTNAGAAGSVYKSIEANTTALMGNLERAVKSKDPSYIMGQGHGDKCNDYQSDIALIQKYDRSNIPIYLIARPSAPSLDYVMSVCLQRPNGFHINPADATHWSKIDQKNKFALFERIDMRKGQVIFIETNLIDNSLAQTDPVFSNKLVSILSNRFRLVLLDKSNNLSAFQVD